MPAGIAGTNVALRFEKLPRDTPLLMSLEQLDELDTHIHCRERKIDFNATIKEIEAFHERGEQELSQWRQSEACS